MKNNNKGFFLAEAIVMITLVTVVMAYVYPNVSNLYGNFKNRTKYWDQPEDIYALKKAPTVCLSDIKTTKDDESSWANSLSTDISNCHMAYFTEVYLTKYLAIPTFNNNDGKAKGFNEYLKKMKRTTNDNEAYRLIGVIDDRENPYRYVSIKVDAEDLK